MCGIFGRFAWDGSASDPASLTSLTDLLAHRGPDGSGYFSEAPFFLGHRRLAIIDLSSTGAQPMSSADGRYVVTFNGEIYNYVELREELTRRGYEFKTRSDTEVLLHGYDAWGDALPSKLTGMFAFAIADRRENELFLARDRFGEKPLLYRETAGDVMFASELLPLARAFAKRDVDLDALAGYLCLNFVPRDRTLMSGVRRLPAGAMRKYGARGLVFAKSYYRPEAAPTRDVDAGDLDGVLADLRTRLDDAVKIGLRSDVPVALFLSGGIDSSLVAESAVRQGALTRAFCLDIDAPTYSEWDGASWVAERLGLSLSRVTLGADVLDDFFDVVSHADDPLADSSAVCLWRLAQATAREFKVAVSGDGGDELFGGYLTYQATAAHAAVTSRLGGFARAAIAAFSPRISARETKVSPTYKLLRFLRAAHLPPSEAHFSWNGAFMPEVAASLLSGDAARVLARGALRDLAEHHALAARPSLSALQRTDAMEYLPNDILVKVDRMTMAHSLESRAPLLNHELAGLALAATPRFASRSPLAKPKRLLRLLADKAFGPRVSAAKKQGFSVPIHAWLRKDRGLEIVQDLLSRRSLTDLPFLEASAVENMRDRFLVRREPLGFEIWGLLVLVAWVRARLLAGTASDAQATMRSRIEVV